MSTQTQPPIMLRASITQAEHKRLKVIALEADKTTQDLIAETLRKHLGLTERNAA
jgi:ATP-dependent Clp protease adapter protein ClpS